MTNMNNAYEVNFDGMVGPTHNYSGLSYGNTASQINRYKSSNPREAALQGLEKMKFLSDIGIKQAILPPHERPFLPILRQLGFTGNDQTIINTVYTQAPQLLFAVSSAAAMWTANAATVSPSMDSRDNLLHLTPANLSNKFHRSIEASTTATILKAIFKDPNHFVHHDCLPAGPYFSDEGAANHTRFCQSHGQQGVQLFVFGRYAFQAKTKTQEPKHFPARQTAEASAAISRLHALDENQTIFIQQNPEAIDAGSFHNDVVAVGNENVFFFHEQAFYDKEKLIKEIRNKVAKQCRAEMIFLEVAAKDIPLKDAISTYLFNSQLITLPNSSMALITPIECQEHSKIKSYINSLIGSKDNPISEVHFLNLRQSMNNGGGPACLRLRIVLTPEELAATHQGVFLTEDLYKKLKKWIMTNYRDRLEINDLADPKLHEEGKHALDDLTKILKLGSLYSFQKSK
jgi:succinylarginine dihydrolase